MKINISNHAKERMETYNLSQKVIEDTIKNPDEIVEGYMERLIAHKAINN